MVFALYFRNSHSDIDWILALAGIVKPVEFAVVRPRRKQQQQQQ